MNVTLLDLKAQYATLRSEIREAIDRGCEVLQFIPAPRSRRSRPRWPRTAKPGSRDALLVWKKYRWEAIRVDVAEMARGLLGDELAAGQEALARMVGKYGQGKHY